MTVHACVIRASESGVPGDSQRLYEQQPRFRHTPQSAGLRTILQSFSCTAQSASWPGHV